MNSKGPSLYSGFNDGKPIWYTHSGPQFRNEKFCEEVNYKIGHRGWYTDGAFRDEVARGIVGRLTHGRFLTGYHLSMNDERVYFPKIYDDQSEAAWAANEHARVIGEQESEYADRFQEGQRLLEKNEANLKRLRECLALRHKFGYTQAEIPDLIAEIRKTQEKLLAYNSL